MNDKTKGNVNLYGCGGTGIKLVSKFEQGAKVASSAKLNCFYIDTSNTNAVGVRAPEERTFIFPGCDGSGHKRDQNARVILDKIAQVLERFPASSPLNILVGSLSGGSGSVIVPALIGELLKEEAPLVIISVASTESVVAVKNTIATIRTLDNYARNHNLPVVMSLHNNGANSYMREVDNDIVAEITSLAMLCSCERPGLDSEDLRNWVQFSRVSDVEPQLAALDIITDISKVDKGTYPVSIASLVSGDSTVGELGADYFCDGPVGDSGIDDTHFIINVNDPTLMMAEFEGTMKDLQRRSQARPKTAALGGGGNGGDLMVF